MDRNLEYLESLSDAEFCEELRSLSDSLSKHDNMAALSMLEAANRIERYQVQCLKKK